MTSHRAHEQHGKASAVGDDAERHPQADGKDNRAATDLPQAFRPTRPQLVAWSIASMLALVIGILYPAYRVNLGLGARDVGGVVMPPGMVMTRDTPGEAMREMAAVDPDEIDYTAPAEARGAQPLQPRIDSGGVKIFDLDVSVVEWNILPDEQVMAYAFNRQVPGPTIRVTVGDRVQLNVTNDLPEETSVHWHGLVVPNEMDGPAYITQPPIDPGERYTYEYTVTQAGTFFYHSHLEPDRQQALGMYGALIVDPAEEEVEDWDLEYTIQLQEWLEREGYTYPAMLMEGALPNFFTINGKAYPATDSIEMNVGERVLFRFIGSSNNFIHPMHIHGGPFSIVATDGNAVPEGRQIEKDTVNVGPGERYDVVWTARKPGRWLLHCHIPHHTTNNNVEEQGAGGLTLIIEVGP